MTAVAAAQVQLVVFSAPKDGYAPEEWEDRAATAFGAGRAPQGGRFIVVDGATETYEAGRWVDQLVTSFMARNAPGAVAGPELQPAALRAWIQAMQGVWQASTPPTTDYIELRKLDEGTLATFLGGQVTGLGGPSPTWQAAALGDTVLFHVRGDRLLAQLPPLRAADFGSAPAGISTKSERLDGMTDHMLFGTGALAPEDTLFAATDAFAQWMIEQLERGDSALWAALGSLHPAAFERLVTEQRRAGAMRDDDVTLLRIRILADRPSLLAVFL